MYCMPVLQEQKSVMYRTYCMPVLQEQKPVTPLSREKRIFRGALIGALQGSSDFVDTKDLNFIASFNVIITFYGYTTFSTAFNFWNIVFKTP